MVIDDANSVLSVFSIHSIQNNILLKGHYCVDKRDMI